jgi:hypothetical protein
MVKLLTYFFREPAGDLRVFILSEIKDRTSKYMAEARREKRARVATTLGATEHNPVTL